MVSIDELLNMNPFEAFLKIKPSIKKRPDLMNILGEFSQAYSEEQRKELENKKLIREIKRGYDSVLYTFGRVGDIYLALRLNRKKVGNFRKEEQEYESYILEGNKYHKLGLTTPRIYGPVISMKNNQKRAFLIVEDLTQNGKYTLVEQETASDGGTREGKDVFFDFDKDPDRINEIKYITDKNAIVIK